MIRFSSLWFLAYLETLTVITTTTHTVTVVFRKALSLNAHTHVHFPFHKLGMIVLTNSIRSFVTTSATGTWKLFTTQQTSHNGIR